MKRNFLHSAFLTLVLASFTFAGNTHCPDDPPPPDGEGRVVVEINENTDPFLESLFDVLGAFQEFLAPR